MTTTTRDARHAIYAAALAIETLVLDRTLVEKALSLLDEVLIEIRHAAPEGVLA